MIKPMKKVKKFYSKIRSKTFSKLGLYALDKFIQSKYLRNNANTVPLTLLATILRGIINFLIISRLYTNVWGVDFLIGLCLTITLTLISPLFYDTLLYLWEEDILYFTNIIIDNLWDKDGLEFFETWKTRILGSLSVLIIIILFFVEINSRMIQEFLVHMLITGFIVDQSNQYILSIMNKKKVVPLEITREEIRTSPLETKIIQIPSSVEVINNYSPNKSSNEDVNITSFIMIPDYLTLKDGMVTSHSSEDLIKE